MKRAFLFRKSLLAVALLSLFLTGCQTLDYRTVQSEFDVAAQQDNGYSSAIVERSTLTVSTYNSVAAKLTDDYIGKLDEKLRPNAYLLRAFSEWRMGKTAESRASAKSGLAAKPESGSRDDIFLSLLKSLNNESEIQKEWRAASNTFDVAAYKVVSNSIENRYREILSGFSDARARVSSATPDSTRYYLSFQEYRTLQNWTSIIRSLSDKIDPALDGKSLQDAALAGAKSILEKDLSVAINDARNSVPATHWLRLRMN